MRIAETVDELDQAGQMFRAFWFTVYIAFSAVVVLYVYTIQQRSHPVATYQIYLDAATRCQRQVSKIADKDSLAERYCLVLEELRSEAVRQTHNVQAIPASAPAKTQQTQSAGMVQNHAAKSGQGRLQDGAGFLQSLNFFNMGDPGGMVELNGSPSSSLADIPSWGHFDSMVSSKVSPDNPSNY